MANMIHRGYEVKQTGAGWTVMQDGAELHTARSEDGALNWIDGVKREQARQQQGK